MRSLPSPALLRLCLLSAMACRTPSGAPGAIAPAPTTAAITAADLRTRLSILADDSMQGRKAGTAGNVRGTDYIASEARRIGLQPAGDDGTFFQTIPMVSRRLASAANIRTEAESFAPWVDFIPRDQGRNVRSIDGVRAVDGGVYGDSAHPAIPLDQAEGKLVVIAVAPQPDGSPAGTVNRAMVTERFRTAAAIAVATLDDVGRSDRESLIATAAQLAGGGGASTPAFMYVTKRMARALLADGGQVVHGAIAFEDLPPDAPARNVVALLPGGDPALRGEIVAIGAHNDHVGMAPTPEDHDSLRAWNRVMRPRGADDSPGRPTAAQSAEIRRLLDSLRALRPPRRDSIFNGADDDGSGSVGVLEVAQALAANPNRPRRTILFVWHTGEELGLIGSDWFTRHPTVPRDSIVAQVNLDMIGRGGASDTKGGGPDYMQVIGSRRLSTELGNLVEKVNAAGHYGFTFDYSRDADGHPDNAYCRSDHYMYARYGIPIAFFTDGDHLDYHQLTDEVQYIDFDKMARMASLAADLARTLADLDHRPVVDKPKPDPNGMCRQ